MNAKERSKRGRPGNKAREDPFCTKLLGRIATFPGLSSAPGSDCMQWSPRSAENEAMGRLHTESLHGYKTTLSLGSRFQNSRYGNGIVSCDLLFLKINVHTKGKDLWW